MVSILDFFQKPENAQGLEQFWQKLEKCVRPETLLLNMNTYSLIEIIFLDTQVLLDVFGSVEISLKCL